MNADFPNPKIMLMTQYRLKYQKAPCDDRTKIKNPIKKKKKKMDFKIS